MSFWDIIWFIIVSFAFIAYLMVLFNIVVDLFRDKTVSGGMKALWMVLLIFFPILTAMVYLIARGDRMAHRQLESIAAANEANQGLREVHRRQRLACRADQPGQGAPRLRRDRRGRVRRAEGQGARLAGRRDHLGVTTTASYRLRDGDQPSARTDLDRRDGTDLALRSAWQAGRHEDVARTARARPGSGR